jgi:hypothetical protein
LSGKANRRLTTGSKMAPRYSGPSGFIDRSKEKMADAARYALCGRGA